MSKLDRILNSNKVILIISILAALALWMAVISEQNPMTDTTFADVKISRVNAHGIEDNELKIISVSSETCDVKVSGRFSEVSSIILSDISLKADFSEITSKGVYTIPVKADVRRNGVEVELVTPDTITVEVDFIHQNDFAVEAEVTGNPAGQYLYTAGSCKVTPAKIRIEGPTDHVDRVDRVVIRVDISGASDSVSAQYAPILLDKDGKIIKDNTLKLEHDQIWAYAPILTKRILPVSIEFGEQTETEDISKFNYEANPTTVAVYGEKATLDKMVDEYGNPRVPTEPLNLNDPEQNSMRLKLDLPEGVTADIEEIDVKIMVAIGQEQE